MKSFLGTVFYFLVGCSLTYAQPPENDEALVGQTPRAAPLIPPPQVTDTGPRLNEAVAGHSSSTLRPLEHAHERHRAGHNIEHNTARNRGYGMKRSLGDHPPHFASRRSDNFHSARPLLARPNSSLPRSALSSEVNLPLIPHRPAGMAPQRRPLLGSTPSPLPVASLARPATILASASALPAPEKKVGFFTKVGRALFPSRYPKDIEKKDAEPKKGGYSARAKKDIDKAGGANGTPSSATLQQASQQDASHIATSRLTPPRPFYSSQKEAPVYIPSSQPAALLAAAAQDHISSQLAGQHPSQREISATPFRRPLQEITPTRVERARHRAHGRRLIFQARAQIEEHLLHVPLTAENAHERALLVVAHELLSIQNPPAPGNMTLERYIDYIGDHAREYHKDKLTKAHASLLKTFKIRERERLEQAIALLEANLSVNPMRYGNLEITAVQTVALRLLRESVLTFETNTRAGEMALSATDYARRHCQKEIAELVQQYTARLQESHAVAPLPMTAPERAEASAGQVALSFEETETPLEKKQRQNRAATENARIEMIRSQASNIITRELLPNSKATPGHKAAYRLANQYLSSYVITPDITSGLKLYEKILQLIQIRRADLTAVEKSVHQEEHQQEAAETATTAHAAYQARLEASRSMLLRAAALSASPRAPASGAAASQDASREKRT